MHCSKMKLKKRWIFVDEFTLHFNAIFVLSFKVITFDLTQSDHIKRLFIFFYIPSKFKLQGKHDWDDDSRTKNETKHNQLNPDLFEVKPESILVTLYINHT